jgi:general secretion pathway protein K
VQSTWNLTGALDWARLILREDRGAPDYLAEPWAVPLQEARLSTFLAADQGSATTNDTADADQVFLSGDITDLQGRLNVGGLVEAGVVPEKRVVPFRRLFDLLGLPQAQLVRMTENLRFAFDLNVDNRNGARAPLPPQRVEQLVWLGLTPETVAALAPYVTILPREGARLAPRTPVNLNTAPAEVIYASISGISLADAQRLVAERERQHLRTIADAKALLPGGADLDGDLVGTGSSYFEVRGRLRIDDVVIEERSVVVRQGREVRTLQRERGATEVFSTTEIKR